MNIYTPIEREPQPKYTARARLGDGRIRGVDRGKVLVLQPQPGHGDKIEPNGALCVRSRLRITIPQCYIQLRGMETRERVSRDVVGRTRSSLAGVGQDP